MRRLPAILIATAVVALALLASPVASVSDAAEPNADAKAWFDGRYGSTFASARSEQSRVALAAELMQFVKSNSSGKPDELTKQRVLYAAEQAYQLGKDHYPAGYRQASEALIAMQRIDRPNRLDYTERLADLFNSVWSQNRTKKLGSGIEYAQAKVQVAQQRLADLFDQYTFTNEVTRKEVFATINAAKRDYQQAFAAANTVLGTATTYQSRVKGDAQAALTEFIDHHAPLRDRIREGQKQLGDFASDYQAVGDQAFPAEAIDAKAALAAALAAQGGDKPAPPDPSKVPSRPSTRPPVAQVDPPPSPDPAVDPQPDPAPSVDPPAPPATTTAPPPTTRRTTGKSVWQQTVCDKCGEAFVPEFGSEAKTCYWCLKKDNIFSGGE